MAVRLRLGASLVARTFCVIRDYAMRRAFLLLAFLLSSLSISATEAPQLGAFVISKEQEYEIGQQLLRNWRRSMPMVSDKVLQHYVSTMVQALASYSNLESYQLQVLLINDDEVNAFAAPGGILGINTGLLKFVDSEAQLAGVIAHELAHLQLRHFVRQLGELEQARQVSTASLVATIGLLLTGNPLLAITTTVGSTAFNAESRLSYSRSYEREADIASLRTLEAAGYGPQVIAGFLRKLQQVSGQNQDLAFLYTHPLSSERVSYLNARLASSSAEATEAASVDFNLQLMRVRISWYNDQRQPQLSADLQLYQDSLEPECAVAEPAARELAMRWRNNIYVQAQWLQVQIDCQPESALATANAFIALFGSSKLSRQLQAQAQLSAGLGEQARASYQQLSVLYPQDLEIMRSYAQVASQTGAPTAALQAQAELMQLQGLFTQALRLLEQARTSASGQSIEQAKITARIAELRQMAGDELLINN